MDRAKLPKKIGVIVVTHNSEATIDPTLLSLSEQTFKPYETFLIDSGSTDVQYIKKYNRKMGLEICLMPNIGFSAANNLGFASLDKDLEYILFLNPDVVMPANLLNDLIEWMDQHPDVGAATPKLIRYDFKNGAPTNKLDSAGIASTWYGKWYDRGQGQDADSFNQEENVEAICGAFFLTRRKALMTVQLNKYAIFDESFFCYKEDLDLSVRMRKEGWNLVYLPQFVAYHGRGWKKRGLVPHPIKMMSAQNELKLHLKSKNPIRITYSLLKMIGVKLFDV